MHLTNYANAGVARFRLRYVHGRHAPISLKRQRLVWVCMVIGALLLTACATTVPAPENSTETSESSDDRLSDIGDVALPTPDPLIVPDVSAVVVTEGSRANIRSGPSLDAPIVAKANPGDTFEITGVSSDGEWWQVCCVPGPADEEEGEASETAWLADVVIAAEGNAEAVPEVTPILSEDLASTWQVDWTCGSERCDVKECSATIDAEVTDSGNQQWLELEHSVAWEDGCFEEDSWSFEVDRYTARERSGEFVDNFLYNYWLGVQPGPPTNIYTLESGERIAVWCSGPQEFELPESGGWTTVYEGRTCHDVRTGEMITLSYTKRWLFTGEYEGQSYERAYFGDYESLEQHLVDTSVNLANIE